MQNAYCSIPYAISIPVALRGGNTMHIQATPIGEPYPYKLRLSAGKRGTMQIRFTDPAGSSFEFVRDERRSVMHLITPLMYGSPWDVKFTLEMCDMIVDMLSQVLPDVVGGPTE